MESLGYHFPYLFGR